MSEKATDAFGRTLPVIIPDVSAYTEVIVGTILGFAAPLLEQCATTAEKLSLLKQATLAKHIFTDIINEQFEQMGIVSYVTGASLSPYLKMAEDTLIASLPSDSDPGEGI